MMDFIRRTWINVSDTAKFMWTCLSLLRSGQVEDVHLPPILLDKLTNPKIPVKVKSCSIQHISGSIDGFRDLLFLRPLAAGQGIRITLNQVRVVIGPAAQLLITTTQTNERSPNWWDRIKSSLPAKLVEWMAKVEEILKYPGKVIQLAIQRLQATLENVELIYEGPVESQFKAELITDRISCSTNPIQQEPAVTGMECQVDVNNPEVSIKTEDSGAQLKMRFGETIHVKADCYFSSGVVEVELALKSIGVEAVPTTGPSRTVILSKDRFDAFKLKGTMAGRHVLAAEVELGDIRLNVAPQIVAVLARIIQASSAIFPVRSAQVDPVPRDHWAPVPFRDRFPELDEALHPPASPSADAGPHNFSIDQLVTFKVHNVKVSLGCGRGVRHRPLVNFDLRLTGEMKNWETNPEARLDVHFGASYYNSNRAVIQPLFEVSRGRRAAHLSIKWNKTDHQRLTISMKEETDLLVTPRLMEVGIVLADAFSAAVNLTDIAEHQQLSETFHSIRNFLPIPVTIDLNGEFKVVPERPGEIVLNPNGELSVSLVNERAYAGSLGILVNVDPFSPVQHILVIDRPDQRYLACKSGQREHGMVAEVVNDFGFKTLILRGSVRVHNQLSVSMKVFHNGQLMGRVGGQSEFNLPLIDPAEGSLSFAASHFTPSGSYSLQSDGEVVILTSIKRSGPRQPFHFRVSSRKDRFTREIHLRPTVVIRNALPYPLTARVVSATHRGEEFVIPPGERAVPSDYDNPDTCWMEIRLENYAGRSDWIYNGAQDKSAGRAELAPCPFLAEDSDRIARLRLGIHRSEDDGLIQLSVFSPCWVVNNTGLDLIYRRNKEDIEHPGSWDTRPILLEFGGQDGLMIKVKKRGRNEETSRWEDVSLTSEGKVSCWIQDRHYLIGSSLHNNFDGLSKQLILTPYFILASKMPGTMRLQYREEHKARWTSLDPGERRPFYPSTDENRRALVFRFADQQLRQTRAVPYKENLDGEALKILPLPGVGLVAGLVVDFRSTPSSVVICCGQLELDDMPRLLYNDWTDVVDFRETPGSNAAQLISLAPGESANYAPCSPALAVYYQNHMVAVDILAQPAGSCLLSTIDPSDGRTVYWTTISYGRLNVLMVTGNGDLFQSNRDRVNLQPPMIQVKFEMDRFGVNLVSDELGDVIYARFRRTKALWIKAKDHMSLSCSAQALQVDNMLADCEYETILAPINLTEGQNRPYIEMHLDLVGTNRVRRMELTLGGSVLSVELQSLLDLRDIVQPRLKLNSRLRMEQRIARDRQNALQGFSARSQRVMDKSARFQLDLFQVTASSVTVSFSTIQTKEKTNKESLLKNPFLDAILSNASGFHQVVFKFPPLIVRQETLSRNQLIQRGMKHVLEQGGQNVLRVIGRSDATGNVGDLFSHIGNAFKRLVSETADGARTGNIGGGLCSGCKHFFSQLCGGCAGCAAQCTSGVGQVVDNVTGNYESNRRRQALRRPGKKNGEKFCESIKSLCKGVGKGWSGVVMDPIKGAKSGGCAGFWKGLGSGFLGFFTRPFSGCMNCSSGLCGIIRDSLEDDRIVLRTRPPRLMESEGVIPHYDRHKADGQLLLRRIDDETVREEKYVDHAPLLTRRAEGKFLILTDRSAIIASGSVMKWRRQWNQLEVRQPERGPQDGQLFFRYRQAPDGKDIGCFSWATKLTKKKDAGKLIEMEKVADAMRIGNSPSTPP